jgi:signal transduction histidine kinase
MLVLATGCGGSLPGTAIERWEASGPDAAELAPPALPPDTLEFSPVDTPHFRSDGSSRVVWLRAHVTWEGLRDPAVLIPRSYIALSAWIDGERVLDGSDYRAASGVPFHLLPLPRGASGEATLVLRVASRYTQVGLPEGARVGDRSTLLEALVRRDLPRLALAMAVMAIGLGALLFALRGRQRKALLGIALFSMGMGAWALFQTRTRELWLPDLPLWFAIWWLSPSATSLGAATFIEAVFGSGPRQMIRVLWWFFLLHSVLLALSLGLDDSFFGAAPWLFLSGRAAMLAGTVAVVAWSFSLARRGDLAARRFVLGFSLASVGIVHDVLVSFGVLSTGVLLSDVGYLGMQLSWVAIVADRVEALERDVSRQAEALARFVRERDELVRDLHDGLGGAVTNVRLLAERAASVGESERGPILSAIGALAAEGMHELRLLMLGFDALPSTWRAAAAELRRAGSTVLEPHDIAVSFRADLSEDRPPDLATFTALMRVHQEALTNVVKHAHARTVRVHLVARSDEVSLTIEDDGVGPSGEEPAPLYGRGVGSMRARARAIGAELTIEAGGPGTRVRLTRR